MDVSVIIPVYNAERFVEEAILSALAQPEVVEVLLIEDGSPDNAIEICRDFAKRDARVHLLQHPNGENRGAGASRNLGIDNASATYVAFLDADDTYLKDRFRAASEAFRFYHDADGVYNTVGVTYHDETLREKHVKRIGSEHTGLAKFIHPQHLFRTLAAGKYGHIHLNGLVLKREALGTELRFDESLVQCQDSDFLFRISRKLKLYGAGSQPVASRGVHPDNRVFDEEITLAFKRIYLRKCIDQKFYGSTDFKANVHVVLRYIRALPVFQPVSGLGVLSSAIRGALAMLFVISHPSILLTLLNALHKKNAAVEKIEIQSDHIR